MDWFFSRKCYKCIASWFPNSLTENNFYTFYSVVRAIQKGVGKSKNREKETFFFIGVANLWRKKCEFLPQSFFIIPIYWLLCPHAALVHSSLTHVILPYSKVLPISKASTFFSYLLQFKLGSKVIWLKEFMPVEMTCNQ